MSRYLRTLIINIAISLSMCIFPLCIESSEFKCDHSSEISALITQLNNNCPEITQKAHSELISMGKSAIPFLSEGLLNKNEDIACACANILGELGVSGLDSLIGFLRNDLYLFLYLPRHQCVIDSLKRIGPNVIPQVLEMCVSYNKDYHPMTSEVFIPFIRNFNESATQYLIKAAKVENPVMQYLALIIQKKIRDESFIPTAIELLNHENIAIKIEAAWTLGVLNENAESSLPNLIKILKSVDDKVEQLDEPFSWFHYKSLKNNLVQVITRIDKYRTIAYNDIFPLIDDTDPEIRKLAIIYLRDSKLNKEDIFRKINSKISDSSTIVRAESVRSIADIDGDKETKIKSLKKAIEDPYGVVRKAALGSLLKVDKSNDSNFQILFRLINDNDPIVQIKALSEIHRFPTKTDAFIPILVEKTINPNDEIKRSALMAIGRFKKPNRLLINSVIKCLNCKNTSVKSSAIKAIRNFGSSAYEAIPLLKNIIVNEQLSLRLNAFDALRKIGPPSKEVLLELLNNDNPQIRELSVRAIGDIRPHLHDSVAYILDLFRHDKNLKVRQAAAISLGKVGEVGDQAISSICNALDNNDYVELTSAFEAIRSMGSSAKCAIPKLLILINNDNLLISKEAINTLAVFGPDAIDAIPDLINIIDKRNLPLLSSAIITIGKIGPSASSTVPYLIDILKDENEQYKNETIRALGKIGYASYPAITTLINSLDEPSNNYKIPTIETLVRISIDAMDTGAIELIDEIKLIEDAIKRHPEITTHKYEEGEHLRTVARAREFLELSIKETFWNRIVSFHKQFHWMIQLIGFLILFYLIWIIALLLIMLVSPILITKIHNSLAEIRINLSNIETKIPLRRFLCLNIFLGNKRVLDSWVKKHLLNSIRNFSDKQTVKQRETHVNLPISLNGKVYGSLKPKDLQSELNDNICSILIQGEGGSGKTHLACQIAKWCMNKDKDNNLFKHIALPVIIEDDIPNSDNPHETLMAVISAQLRLIIGSSKKVPYPLLMKLLENKRVVLIIDHLSEMSEFTVTAINSLLQHSVINALIVTSRIDEQLAGNHRVTLNPLRLKKGHLRHFFDAFFRKRDQIDLFEDLELGKLLDKLSNLVGKRDITVLLCRLYADQLVAFKKNMMEDLPRNIPELMLQYLNELNRNVIDDRIPDRLIHSYAKAIAWLSIRQNLTSSYVSIKDVLDHLNKTDSIQIVQYFNDILRIVKTIQPAKDKIKFVIDPIAEYLASMYIVETFQKSDWLDLIDRLNKSKDELQKASGFISSLIDCYNANLTNAELPRDILQSLIQISDGS